MEPMDRKVDSPMLETFQYLKAVVFDWAGTTIDHGCMAPAIVFKSTPCTLISCRCKRRRWRIIAS